MEREGALRIRTFRPDGFTSVVDARIRDEIGPAAASTPGLVAFYAGRRGVEPSPERVLVTIWESVPALEAAGRSGRGILALEADLAPAEVEILPVLVGVIDDTGAAPTVLRLFRGRTRHGALGTYAEAVRDGTNADIAGGTGPLELHLGAGDDDDFVTVSSWTSWAPIEVATGGNVERPIATRHVALLEAGRVAHYEIIPNSVSGLVRRPSLVE